MNSEQKSKLLKGAALTGVINAVINGGIQYFFLKGKTSIPFNIMYSFIVLIVSIINE